MGQVSNRLNTASSCFTLLHRAYAFAGEYGLEGGVAKDDPRRKEAGQCIQHDEDAAPNGRPRRRRPRRHLARARRCVGRRRRRDRSRCPAGGGGGGNSGGSSGAWGGGGDGSGDSGGDGGGESGGDGGAIAEGSGVLGAAMVPSQSAVRAVPGRALVAHRVSLCRHVADRRPQTFAPNLDLG